MKTHKDTRGPPRGLFILKRPFIRSRTYKEMMKPTIPIVPGKFKTRGGDCLIQEAREKMKTDFGAANQPGKFDEDNKFTSETRTGQDWILQRQEPKNLHSNCANILARPIVLGKFKTRGGGSLIQESRAEAREKMETHKGTRGPPRGLFILKRPIIRSRTYKEMMKPTIPIVPGKFNTRGGGCLIQEARAEASENMQTNFGAANQPGRFDIADEDRDGVTKFSISAPLREKLKANGIKVLLPIQATTFEQILDGYDLVCRAHTSQEKTLAFVLPILESLTNGHVKGIGYKNRGYGRPPRVLVLLPTRKRASQVFEVFKVYGGSLGLASCYVCRAATCTMQEQYLKRGVDIVVGTPCHVKDLLEKGSLNLSSLKFRVLDEADEMLRMGFAKDVELILVKAGVSKVQTLLFSATFPEWVSKLSHEFPNPLKTKSRDFVGYEKIQASTNVRHIAMPGSASAISQWRRPYDNLY